MWGRILGATPVAMTVVATLLAGLASSEMTRAQYDRAFAAQLQSKAGDQWNLFQAKKLRGALQRTTLDLMASLSEGPAPEPVAGDGAAAAAGSAAVRSVAEATLPKLPPLVVDPAVKAAQASLDARSEAEITALVAAIPPHALADALEAARARARAFDAAEQPILARIDQADKQLAGAGGSAALRRAFASARLRFTALRYDAEAQLNQAIASLYELQVRRGNLGAERHQRRSQEFFLGMLAAQAGVVVSTLAMAARQRNLLWSLAAGAGLFAIAFAVYVYLFG